jgi:hypothetical protein
MRMGLEIQTSARDRPDIGAVRKGMGLGAKVSVFASKKRAARVLPNPDNSCAYDTSTEKIDRAARIGYYTYRRESRPDGSAAPGASFLRKGVAAIGSSLAVKHP